MNNNYGTFIPVLQFIAGLAVFGFIYWLLNGILDIIIGENIHETGTIWSFMTYLWAGIIIIYIIFSGIWLIRKYNEQEYMNGGQY
jgi:hypothetical protein